MDEMDMMGMDGEAIAGRDQGQEAELLDTEAMDTGSEGNGIDGEAGDSAARVQEGALPDEGQRAHAAYLVQEEEAIRREDPDFDLLREMKDNATFRNLVMMGEPLKKVYDYFHMEKKLEQTAREVEKGVVQRIRERNLRPAPLSEGGRASARMDMGKASEEELRRIDERLKRGEKVYIG